MIKFLNCFIFIVEASRIVGGEGCQLVSEHRPRFSLSSLGFGLERRGGEVQTAQDFFFFKLVFQQFDYYVYGHGLLWIYPVWGSQSSLTPYIWKVFSHISLNIFSTPVFFSFHGTPMTQIQTPGYCPIDFRGPGSLFVCFNPFALYSSDWIISMIFEFTDFLFFCHLYSASKAIH